jgi:hypothetical protein
MDTLTAVADTVVATKCALSEQTAALFGGFFFAGVILTIVIMKLKDNGWSFSKK